MDGGCDGISDAPTAVAATVACCGLVLLQFRRLGRRCRLCGTVSQDCSRGSLILVATLSIHHRALAGVMLYQALIVGRNNRTNQMCLAKCWNISRQQCNKVKEMRHTGFYVYSRQTFSTAFCMYDCTMLLKHKRNVPTSYRNERSNKDLLVDLIRCYSTHSRVQCRT